MSHQKRIISDDSPQNSSDSESSSINEAETKRVVITPETKGRRGSTKDDIIDVCDESSEDSDGESSRQSTDTANMSDKEPKRNDDYNNDSDEESRRLV